MEVDNQVVYKFSFKSPGMSDNMAHFVLSNDLDKMRLFLKQHNFVSEDIIVECDLLKDHEGDDEFMLQQYLLKSNSSDKVYKIMTTEHLVYDCAQSLGSLLSSSLIFGTAITREDVPIMKFISELVFALDHVYILDHTLCDSEGKPFSTSYDKYAKCGFPSTDLYDERYMLTDEPAGYDDSAIYESISTSVVIDKPLPFTIEMYVSYFASLLTDSYN